MEDFKRTSLLNKVPIITDEGLAFICNYIRDNHCKKILEIGTAVGYSAINFSLVNDAYVTTIERNEEMYREALKNIKNFSRDNYIEVLLVDALEFDCHTLKKDYDLLFIDAAKAQYEKFFHKYTPYLKDTGVIICDNLNFHGWTDKTVFPSRSLRQLVKKINLFKDFLKRNEEYETIFYNVGDGMSISKKR